jgi:hypothetical protein
MMADNPDPWQHRSEDMKCRTCMWFVQKSGNPGEIPEETAKKYKVGRCRRHAPTMNGYPVCFENDWCGDHKLDETKAAMAPICPQIQLCESCSGRERQWDLKSDNGEVYLLCSNCLIELVNLCLSPAHFKSLIRNGHKATEFMLHSDFYDEDGIALQPRGA